VKGRGFALAFVDRSADLNPNMPVRFESVRFEPVRFESARSEPLCFEEEPFLSSAEDAAQPRFT
jgi:hypothetical protein